MDQNTSSDHTAMAATLTPEDGDKASPEATTSLSRPPSRVSTPAQATTGTNPLAAGSTATAAATQPPHQEPPEPEQETVINVHIYGRARAYQDYRYTCFNSAPNVVHIHVDVVHQRSFGNRYSSLAELGRLPQRWPRIDDVDASDNEEAAMETWRAIQRHNYRPDRRTIQQLRYHYWLTLQLHLPEPRGGNTDPYAHYW